MYGSPSAYQWSVSLPIIGIPEGNTTLFNSSSRNTEDTKSTSNDTERSFSSYLKSYSEDNPSDTPQSDAESSQPVQPVPIQIQIPLSPPVQSAPLTAELRLGTVSTDGTEAAIIHSAGIAQPKSEHKDLFLPESLILLPAVESLPLPTTPSNMDGLIAKKAAVADQIRPSIQSNLAILDDQKAPARKLEPSGKSSENQEVAFTATIKEAVQSEKSQSNGGENRQQDPNSQERPTHAQTTVDAIQQPGASLALNAPEKPVNQTLVQAKIIDAPKPANMTLVHPVLDDRPAAATGAATSISLKVESLNSGVDVKLMERGGVIQVSVRTGDRELTGDIRGRLNELVDSLSGKGYETRTWTPDAGISSVSSTFQSQNEPRNSNQGEPGKGGANDDSSSGRQSKGDRREPEQQNGRHEKPKNLFRTILEGARP